MTAPVFDPAIFGGDPESPPMPMVIRWDDLDPAGYSTTLTSLARWLQWFRSTYRIPATVFPPCWFTHPGIREDLGHLWSGWLVTRHPDAGVGMIGLDWDSRREQAISRLREATAITGCTGTQHREEPPIPTPPDARLWDQHVTQEVRARSQEELRVNAIHAVNERLQNAELRHDLAAKALADLSDNPETLTDKDKASVAAELHRLAGEAPGVSAKAARDAIRTVADIQQTGDRETTLAAARHTLATSIAAEVLNGTESRPTGLDASQVWRDALEALLPAGLAANRAAAVAATRSEAVNRRVAAQTRHPGIAHLLAGGDTPDWEGNPG